MRSAAPPAAALVGGGTLALCAYLFAKPALFIALLTCAALTIFYACLRNDWRVRLGWRPALVAVAMPLLAWWIADMWTLYAALALVVPIAARRRSDVAPLYLLALMLLPGLDTVIMIGSLKLFDCGIHDMLAFGAAARLVFEPQRERPIRPGIDLPVAILLLLIVFATARDTSATNFLRVLINTLMDCALPYFIVSRGLRTGADVKLCLVYLAAAASILSVILLYEVHTSWPIYNGLYAWHGLKALLLVKERGGVLRAGGPFLEPTSIAMVIAFCVLAAWLSRPAFRSRLAHGVVLALLLAGLTGPQSRGAWIGLLIGTVSADLYRGRVAPAANRLLVIAALGGALMTVAPMSPYLSDTLGLSEGSSSTVDYRSRLLNRGMEEFWKSPVIGYSPPVLLQRLQDLQQGEGIIDFVNTYIYFALVSGVVGLIIFVATFLFYVRGLLRERVRLGAVDADLVAPAFVFAGLVMPMEMLFFTSFGGRPEAMVFVLCGAAATLIAGAETVTVRRGRRRDERHAITSAETA